MWRIQATGAAGNAVKIMGVGIREANGMAPQKTMVSNHLSAP
jgi:hypothetical protein